MGTSPAQRMLNRRTRTILPTFEEQLTHLGSELHKADQARTSKSSGDKESITTNLSKILKFLRREIYHLTKAPFRVGKEEWGKGVVLQRLDDV